MRPFMNQALEDVTIATLAAFRTMTNIAPTAGPSSALAFRLFGSVAEHGLALVLPLCTLSFLLTGPHTAGNALLWTLPVWLFIAVDFLSPPDRRAPARDLPAWPFDGLLYLLATLQFANIVLMVRLASQLTWTAPDGIIVGVANLLAIRILVGTNSCCSCIAVAHELIHRRGTFPRLLGRGLLLTVCYEHFAVEHLRRHHRHVGTAEDPATARYGETYATYWRRTKLEQFRSAWALENARLGLHAGLRLSGKLLRHEVFLGATAEIALIVLILTYCGLAAAIIFLLQALAAVRLLEAVNYFQHWGLERRAGLAEPFDAWVTESWFSRHVFVGLARHSDHHRHGAKAYQRLDFCGRGPRLPYGYFGMALLAKSFNTRFQQIARAELHRYSRSESEVSAFDTVSSAPVS